MAFAIYSPAPSALIIELQQGGTVCRIIMEQDPTEQDLRPAGAWVPAAEHKPTAERCEEAEASEWAQVAWGAASASVQV